MDASKRVNAELRQIPAVDRLIGAASEGNSYAAWSVRQAAREVVEAVRKDIRARESQARVPDFDVLVSRTRTRAAELERPAPRREDLPDVFTDTAIL